MKYRYFLWFVFVFWSMPALFAQVEELQDFADDKTLRIFQAVWGSDHEQVKKLLDANAELVNARNQWHDHFGGRETPLHMLCDGDVQTAKYLVEKGADINARNASELTPLHHAVMASSDNLELIKFLINSGADVNAANLHGRTPVFHATFPIHLKFLVKNGADLAWKDNAGNTPLHFLMNQIDMYGVQFLIESGADINTQNDAGVSPFDILQKNKKLYESLKPYFDEHPEISINHKEEKPVQENAEKDIFDAIADNDFEKVRKIIEKHPEVVKSTDQSQWDLRRASVRNFRTDIDLFLMQYGNRVGLNPHDGSTPLHTAARYASDTRIIELLLDHGADIEARDNCGNTPLILAVAGYNPMSIGLCLLERGADIYARNYLGYTPGTVSSSAQRKNFLIDKIMAQPDKAIFDFVVIGDLKTVRKMMADDPKLIHVKGEVGETLLHWAMLMESPSDYDFNKLDMVKYLVGKGCDVNAVNDYRQTPLCYVLSSLRIGNKTTRTTDDTAVVRFLLERGADVNTTVDSYFPVVSATLPKYKMFTKFFSSVDRSSSGIDDDGITLLHMAVISNTSNATLQLLLDYGIDVNAKTKAGLTALHIVAYNSSQLIPFLVQQGANIEAKTNDGFTPVYFSLCSPYTNNFKAMAAQGADLNVSDHRYGYTPMHVAILCGNAPYSHVVNLMIDAGADVNKKDHAGNSPLHLTADVVTGCSLTEEYLVFLNLVRHGGDIHAKNNKGQTPFDMIEDPLKKEVFSKAMESP